MGALPWLVPPRRLPSRLAGLGGIGVCVCVCVWVVGPYNLIGPVLTHHIYDN